MIKEISAGAVVFKREKEPSSAKATEDKSSSAKAMKDKLEDKSSSAKAMEDKGIKYLLLRYGSKKNPKHWEFPRGGMEKNEKSIETARREIWEESGIKYFKFIQGFEESVVWFYKRIIRPRNKHDKILKSKIKTVTIFKRAIFYLAETKSKKVKISFEHADYAWLDYKNAIEQLTFKNAKNILKKANNFLLKEGLNHKI